MRLTNEVDSQDGRYISFFSTPEHRQVRVFEDEEETLVILQSELLGSETRTTGFITHCVVATIYFAHMCHHHKANIRPSPQERHTPTFKPQTRQPKARPTNFDNLRHN